jgi:hypothetical protein
MDPITISVVLIALIGGVGSGIGTSLWTGLGTLVRRPFRHHQDDGATAAVPSGEQELAALQQAPVDKDRALDLAQVLVGRANGDPEFRQALQAWWDQAEPVRKTVLKSNTISGGTFYGPVFQADTVTGNTFGSPAPPPPSSPS